MGALTDHLTDPDGHDALAFHRDCPICSAQRLRGQLIERPMVGTPVRAGVVATALALSTAAPATAAEDQEISPEELQEVLSETPEEPDSEPVANPGEGEIPNPADIPEAEDDETGNTPEDLPTSEGGTVEQNQTGAAPRPGSQRPLGGKPAPGAPGDLPGAGEPAAPTAGDEGDAQQRPGGERGGKSKSRARAEERGSADGGADGGSSGTQTTPAPQPSAGDDPGSAPPTGAGGGSDDASSGGGPSMGGSAHVVQQGDTLWSIARELLGPGASASEIASEVQRLWRLNADRIESGSPDLIVAGEVLRLR